MSDIFREVDEDIRKERLDRLWKRLAPFVYVLAFLVVAGTAGYRGWEYWQETNAKADGEIYASALKILDEVAKDQEKLDEKIAEAKEEEEKNAENNTDGDESTENTDAEEEETENEFEIEAAELLEKKQEAYELFRSLDEASGGYPVLSKMRLATELALDGELEEAVEVYDLVIEDNSVQPLFRELAAVRAAYILIDGEDMAAVRQRILGLSGDDNPWRHLVWEILAFTEWKDKKGVETVQWLDKLTEDEDTPRGVSRRAESMKRLLKSEGFESEVDKKKEEEEKANS